MAVIDRLTVEKENLDEDKKVTTEDKQTVKIKNKEAAGAEAQWITVWQSKHANKRLSESIIKDAKTKKAMQANADKSAFLLVNPMSK